MSPMNSACGMPWHIMSSAKCTIFHALAVHPHILKMYINNVFLMCNDFVQILNYSCP